MKALVGSSRNTRNEASRYGTVSIDTFTVALAHIPLPSLYVEPRFSAYGEAGVSQGRF